MAKAVGYARRSTDKQPQSIADQRREVEAFAKQNGITIVREMEEVPSDVFNDGFFVDDAVSGAETTRRTAFQAMVELVVSGRAPFTHVLCYDLKRFGRVEPDEAGYFRYLLRQHGVEVIYVREGFKGDETDELLRPVKQWQALNELRELSRDTIRGQVSRARTGVWAGGTPAYGYDLEYRDPSGRPYQRVRYMEDGTRRLLDPEANEIRALRRGEKLFRSQQDTCHLVPSLPQRLGIVRLIFELRVLHRYGLKQIAAKLNETGAPSPRNGNWSDSTAAGWSVSTIRSILMNVNYVGDGCWNRRALGKFYSVAAVDGGHTARRRPPSEAGRVRRNDRSEWVVIPNTHAAIIDRDTFEAAQATFRDRRLPGGRARRSPYLLSGLLRCSDCGHMFQGHTTKAKKARKDGSAIETRYYMCGGYHMKGTAICSSYRLPLPLVDEFVLGEVDRIFGHFLKAEDVHKELLRLVREQLGPGGSALAGEVEQAKDRLREIDKEVDALVGSVSRENLPALDGKLTALRHEKERLQACVSRHAGTQSAHVTDVDVGAARILQDIRGNLACASPQERKTFIRAFLKGICFSPRKEEGTAAFYRFPELISLTPSGSSFRLVAGAGFEPATFRL